MTGFGDRLKKLRMDAGLSQKELATRVNCHKNAISNYETNKRVPDADALYELAVCLNVSVDYLLGLEKPQMLSVGELTEDQLRILTTLSMEFRSTKQKRSKKLTPRQQSILNDILSEFSTERD